MRLFALGLLGLIACAHAPTSDARALKRRDWVLTWDKEVERTSRFGDQDIKLISPAEGAVRQVRLQQELDAEMNEGKRPKTLGILGMISPPIFDTSGPIRVRCGAIEERTIEGEPYRVIEHSPIHARVFWTEGRFRVRSGGPREAFSSLFIEGRSAGSDSLVLLPAQGGPDVRVEIQVECDAKR